MIFRIAIIALFLHQTVSAYTWGWAKSGQTCAGVYTDCDNKASCTTTAVGPCSGSAPTEYLKSEFVGMAFVKSADYLSNTASFKKIDPTGLGYRDFNPNATVGNDGKYAYTMSGNYFGENNAGGYIGIASYLNTGASEIKTPTNDVYLATTKTSTRTTRDDSTIGAPDGPFTVCITDEANCGGTRTFKSGEYKFSVFGKTTGTDYGTTIVAGQNGFPVGMDHIGVRMKLTAVGFKVEGLKVNGADYAEANVANDVTKMAIAHGDGELALKFPLKYNYGSTASAAVGTTLPVAGTKNVKIRVHGADKTAGTVFIDYLFEHADLNAKDKYFMYDPSITGTVKAAAKAAKASTGSATSLSYSLSSLLLVCVTLLATLM